MGRKHVNKIRNQSPAENNKFLLEVDQISSHPYIQYIENFVAPAVLGYTLPLSFSFTGVLLLL